jgi:DNA-binding phage protein
MAGRRKTAFDRYLDERLKDKEFAREYAEARAEITTIDQIIRLLDTARKELNLSKAELARRIGAKPEIVRRLLTAEDPTPTIATVVKIAAALNLRLDLVPKKEAQGATERGRRFRYSSPNLETAP